MVYRILLPYHYDLLPGRYDDSGSRVLIRLHGVHAGVGFRAWWQQYLGGAAESAEQLVSSKYGSVPDTIQHPVFWMDVVASPFHMYTCACIFSVAIMQPAYSSVARMLSVGAIRVLTEGASS